MTKAEYLEFHKNFCQKMVDITAKKNADYSGAGGDPFNNFRHIGALIHVENIDIVAAGFLTRMSDKFSRIGSFIAKGELQVKDESVEDTLIDLANYSALMAGYLRERAARLRELSKAESRAHLSPELPVTPTFR